MCNEPIDDAIRRRLSRYLAGRITLRQFRAWFFPATWDVESHLAATISLRLAEYTSGHWMLADFNGVLAHMLTR